MLISYEMDWCRKEKISRIAKYEIMEVQKCNISYIYLICLNLPWPTLFS